jgi:hypothetical protein
VTKLIGYDDLIAKARSLATLPGSLPRVMADALEQLKLERSVLEHRLLRYQKVVEAARYFVFQNRSYDGANRLADALKGLDGPSDEEKRKDT